MKKIIILILMLSMITGVITGCSEDAPETAPETATETATETAVIDGVMQPPSVGATPGGNIGIAMPTKDNLVWNNTGDLINKELRSLGYTTTLDYASNDVSTQVTQIENMLNSDCKCLIIAAVEVDSLVDVLETAKEKNVPVISYDRLIMNSDAVSYYVAFDPYKIGAKQGEYIRDKLDLDATDGQYNIELFSGDPDENYAKNMFSGAMDVLSRYIDEGKLVVKSGQTDFKEVATSSWEPNSAKRRMEAILGANYSDGTTLHAVLCSGDSCALGVTEALKNNYNGAWPIITGSGCEIENVKNILKGEQSMSVFCDSRTLASKAAEMADAIIKGEEVQVNDNINNDYNDYSVPSFLCEPVFADKDNYAEILVESGFYSEDELR